LFKNPFPFFYSAFLSEDIRAENSENAKFAQGGRKEPLYLSPLWAKFHQVLGEYRGLFVV